MFNNLDYSVITKDIYNFINHNIDLNSFSYIPAVKYRDEISTFCNSNELISKLRLYCFSIMLKDNSIFYTSNDAYLSAGYMSSGLYRADNFFLQALRMNKSFVLSNEIDNDDLMRNLVYNILTNGYNIFNAYCLIRTCEDCTVIIALAQSFLIENLHDFYKETICEVEDFSIQYIDHFLHIYADNLPQLKHTRFIQDQAFRKNVIKNRNITLPEINLTNREKECLYWLSLGKTAEETALLMSISEYTVVEHKKKIMQKLNVSNVVHAVKEAMNLKLL